MATHDDTIRREFAKQSASFEDPTYSFADRRFMDWILQHVPCAPGEVLLDVAGGTGHMARALAEKAAFAVVLDLTEEMLATGARAAASAGRRNVVFQAGDASRMPFVDESFDLVACRFAVHHFEQPERQLAEMTRVCRTGGHVAIIDLVAPDEALATDQNRLERMRDPSHTRALSIPELSRLLRAAGAPVVHETHEDRRVRLDRWLAQAKAPAEVGTSIRAELEAELKGDTATGMRPVVHEGKLHFTQRWAILVGRKAHLH